MTCHVILHFPLFVFFAFAVCLAARYLLDTACVATTFEGSIEVLVEDAFGYGVGDKAAGHDEDVSIVVLTGKLGNLGTPAEGSTDALMLVEGHVDAVSATADGDAALVLTSLDG